MKTSEQIKGAIRNISKKTGANPNSLLQMCLFEGVLIKISKSQYHSHFIIKGGLLISSLIGVNLRSTMDMDATIKGLPVKEESLRKILEEILAEPIDGELHYELNKLTRIREQDVYEDYCANITCNFGKIKATLNIDITTGDVITPNEVSYQYPKILEEGYIPILSYTIETILAEKFETISSRNITTTRARDFYDLFMIYTLFQDKINKQTLRQAIENTSIKRESYKTVLQYKKIAQLLKDDDGMKKLWTKYINSNPYAREISLLDTIEVYEEIGSGLIL